MSYYENLFMLSLPILMVAAFAVGGVCRPRRVPAEVTLPPHTQSTSPLPPHTQSTSPLPPPSPKTPPSPPPYTTVVTPS